jgi:hypothetical protein
MRKLSAFPPDSVGGHCFITRKPRSTEGVIDLNVDLETLPAHGRLCIHPIAVRAMCDLMGWVPVDKADQKARLDELDRENAELRAQLDEARNALSDVLRARDLVDAMLEDTK